MVTLVCLHYALSPVVSSHISTQLFRAKRGLPFGATRSILSKLIVLTIETGAITAVATIVDLCLYLGTDGTTWFTLSVPPLLVAASTC
jgi:hypothetical protein